MDASNRWVSEALKHSGLTQAALARALSDRMGDEYDRSKVNKMVTGGKGRKKRRVSADEMLAIEEITGYQAPAEARSNIVKVRLLSWVSAGRLLDAESQIPVEDVPLLAFADLGRGDFFALKVDGDSMDRLSPDGSIIVVNRAEKDLSIGKPYIFWHRSEGTTFKIWQPEPARLEPSSWNGANKPIYIKRKSDFGVIGRVRRTVLDL